MIRSAFIVIFGVIPSTCLAMFAGLVAVVGVCLVFSGHALGGLLLATWGSLGVFGTVALWSAAIRPLSKLVVLGLASGSLALLPLSLDTTNIHTASDFFFRLGLMSPLFVAAYLLVEFARTCYLHPNSVEPSTDPTRTSK